MIHEIIGTVPLFSLSPWGDITVVTENEIREEGLTNNANKNSQVHYYSTYLDHHNVYAVGIDQLV